VDGRKREVHKNRDSLARFGLRVDEEDEYEGLDLSQHGESGYNIEDAFSATYAGGGATLLSGDERHSAAFAGSAHG
jgi:hypothetical protein